MRVADAIQTGVKDGTLYGPMKLEELPWKPKISPMTVRLKLNGNVCIILDLSAPHRPMLGEGEACSRNAGMKCHEQFEPVRIESDVH